MLWWRPINSFMFINTTLEKNNSLYIIHKDISKGFMNSRTTGQREERRKRGRRRWDKLINVKDEKQKKKKRALSKGRKCPYNTQNYALLYSFLFSLYMLLKKSDINFIKTWVKNAQPGFGSPHRRHVMQDVVFTVFVTWLEWQTGDIWWDVKLLT